MPLRLSFPSHKIALFALGLIALPSPAFAGFQWVPPTEAPAPLPPPVSAAPQSVISAAPMPAPNESVISTAPLSATSAPEVITPIIIEGTPAPSATVVAPQPAAVKNLDPQQMHTLAVPPAASAGVVHGFAKQVPLAVALRQILPTGYGFSVDPDVDLGVLISFQGGKPWRETLTEALDAAGLVMRERGQMITIGRMDGTPISVSPRTVSSAPAPMISEHYLEQPSTVDAPTMALHPAQTITMGAETWKAEPGDSLHKVMEVWTHRSNIELNWMAEYDYPVQASFSFTGSFEDAVRQLLTGFQDAQPQPIAELHSNPSLGQKVMVVQTRGNAYN